jgi:hypothetical protein
MDSLPVGGKAVSPFVALHIAAGTVSLIAGTASLAARKGGRAHLRAGRVFAPAMLLMSGSSVVLALAKGEPDNVVVGALTFYLVASGWHAMRAPRNWSPFDSVALAWVGVAALASFAYGLMAASTPDGRLGGVPALNLFALTAIVAAFAGSDLRRVARGVASPLQPLRRHVWRMSFAMFIATLSLFFGQAQVFPDAVRAAGVHLVPVFLVAGVTLYWLTRLHLFGGWRAGGPHAHPHRIPFGARPDVG